MSEQGHTEAERTGSEEDDQTVESEGSTGKESKRVGGGGDCPVTRRSGRCGNCRCGEEIGTGQTQTKSSL